MARTNAPCSCGKAGENTFYSKRNTFYLGPRTEDAKCALFLRQGVSGTFLFTSHSMNIIPDVLSRREVCFERRTRTHRSEYFGRLTIDPGGRRGGGEREAGGQGCPRCRLSMGKLTARNTCVASPSRHASMMPVPGFVARGRGRQQRGAEECRGQGRRG